MTLLPLHPKPNSGFWNKEIMLVNFFQLTMTLEVRKNTKPYSVISQLTMSG